MQIKINLSIVIYAKKIFWSNNNDGVFYLRKFNEFTYRYKATFLREGVFYLNKVNMTPP